MTPEAASLLQLGDTVGTTRDPGGAPCPSPACLPWSRWRWLPDRPCRRASAAPTRPPRSPPLLPRARPRRSSSSATNDPLRAPGSDGADHLEYDLLVTNAFTAPVTLSSIEVLAEDGERLLRLAGDDLVAATQPLLEGTATEAIPASGTVAVVMDVPVPPERAVERLDHRIAYEVAPDAPGRSLFGSFEVDRAGAAGRSPPGHRHRAAVARRRLAGRQRLLLAGLDPPLGPHPGRR